MEKKLETEERHVTSVRALSKAIRIIETLAFMDRDVDLASLSRKIDMPKSTLLRLLNTMKNHNLVRQDPATKRFSLGLGLVALGKAAERNFDLAREIHSYLVELAEKTGETASLMTLEGDHAVYIDQVVSNSLIRGQPKIGLNIDLHCSSGGKVLLSAFSDSELHTLFEGRKLRKYTEKTITSLDRLVKEIQRVREAGYATDDEEVEAGGRCVAAPLRDGQGKIVAAVSITGPTMRIRQKDFARLAGVVKQEVLEASRSLGYEGGVSA